MFRSLRLFPLLLLAAFLCLPVTSCATYDAAKKAVQTVTNVKVTKTQVYIAANAFNAAKASATNYIDLPICLPGQTFLLNACSRRAIIDRIVPAIKAGTQNRKDLLAYVKTNPDALGVSGAYQAIKGLTQTIQAALAEEGVKS